MQVIVCLAPVHVVQPASPAARSGPDTGEPDDLHRG